MSEPQMMPLLRTGLYVDFRVLDEKQAMRNHGQTLARLAERGGLGPCEALAIMQKRNWQATGFNEALRAVSVLADLHMAKLGARIAPFGVQFLFIALGECDDPAMLRWCTDEAAVRDAVRDALYMEGADLSDLDKEIIEANAQELLDTGGVDFEGDPRLRLVRVGTAS